METFAKEDPINFGDVLEEEDDVDDYEAQPSGKKVKDEFEVSIGGGMGNGDLAEIYTDGSTLSNGQEGAVAGVGVFFGDNDPRFVRQAKSLFPGCRALD